VVLTLIVAVAVSVVRGLVVREGRTVTVVVERGRTVTVVVERVVALLVVSVVVRFAVVVTFAVVVVGLAIVVGLSVGTTGHTVMVLPEPVVVPPAPQ